MGEVAEALQVYERTISDLGFDIYSTVSGGLERTDIVDQLAAAGVDPIDDVVDWFAFSNGLLPVVPGEPRLGGVFDGVMVVSLEEALAERAARLDPDFLLNHGLDETQVKELADADLLVPFEPTWMPISRGKQTCVIETERSADAYGRLISLWSDELSPRIKAPSMSAWVRGLIKKAEAGEIREHSPSRTWRIAEACYELGSVHMPESDARLLQISVPPQRVNGRCSELRLKHAPVGSLAGNAGLEEVQVRDLERLLREVGIVGPDYVYEQAAADIDHIHMIEIYGVVG